MPRSKNPATYPEAFADLLREGTVREVRVPFASPAEARRLMGRLYSYHSSLEAATRRDGCPEDIRELRHLSTKVQYRVELNELIARPSDQDPAAQAIMASLQGQSHEPTLADKMQPSSDLLKSLKGDAPDE